MFDVQVVEESIIRFNSTFFLHFVNIENRNDLKNIKKRELAEWFKAVSLKLI
jgi:hypothetical protein